MGAMAGVAGEEGGRVELPPPPARPDPAERLEAGEERRVVVLLREVPRPPREVPAAAAGRALALVLDALRVAGVVDAELLPALTAAGGAVAGVGAAAGAGLAGVAATVGAGTAAGTAGLLPAAGLAAGAGVVAFPWDRDVGLAMAGGGRQGREKGGASARPRAGRPAEDHLAIGFPEIDDPADGQIRLGVRHPAGEAGGRATGGEHPVAGRGADRIHRHGELALGVAQRAQIPVQQPLNPLGADDRAGDLHDLHHLLPPLEDPLAGGACLPASGSQWSMMPTMVRSLG
ncbi:protein of unknown function [Cyanobium sp. NIES-981]|nr:protein of unknown function [Cyanobium sp. NIES-981]